MKKLKIYLVKVTDIAFKDLKIKAKNANEAHDKACDSIHKSRTLAGWKLAGNLTFDVDGDE